MNTCIAVVHVVVFQLHEQLYYCCSVVVKHNYINTCIAGCSWSCETQLHQHQYYCCSWSCVSQLHEHLHNCCSGGETQLQKTCNAVVHEVVFHNYRTPVMQLFCRWNTTTSTPALLLSKDKTQLHEHLHYCCSCSCETQLHEHLYYCCSWRCVSTTSTPALLLFM